MQKRKRLLAFSGLAAVLLILGILVYWGFQTRQTFDTRQQASHTPQTVVVNPTQINTYLPNPGIGWQEADNPLSPLLPETVNYQRGTDTYSWSSVNPADGVFNWAGIDADLAAAVAQGKQFSFRVVTMRGPGFGGHQIPQWVMDRGAETFSNGEPDYSNCTYQEEWANFVQALRQHYDGNPNIAFIDISGYGNFNEWSFQNVQTETDTDGTNPTTVDGQARKRLADMFIGGSGTTQCRTGSGNNTQTVQYSYPGFQQTQLLMPFAGIRQSTQYVFSRRQDVGFRFDCLGRADSTDSVMSAVGTIIDQLWPQAPVVFEYCGSRDTTPAVLAEADQLLRAAHGSLTHDNFPGNRDTNAVENILRNVGYRYHLDQATCVDSAHPGDTVPLIMNWQNIGYAPNYPRMGQTFALRAYLVDASDQVVQQFNIPVNTPSWLPADPLPGTAPINTVNGLLALNGSVIPGNYTLKVAILDTRTNLPINLSFSGRDANGRYPVCGLAVLADDGTEVTPTIFPTVSPSIEPTPSVTPSASPTVSASPSTSPTSSPLASATPSTSPSTSPSGTPFGLVCASITSTNFAPHVGESVTFMCGQIPGATHYEFRYQVNGGAFSVLSPTTANNNISQPLTISQAGAYYAQCRPCNANGCAEWE